MTVGGLLSALLAAFLAVAVTMAILVLIYRRVLRRRLVDELVRLSGPSVVHSLSPQQVMTTFLSTIYGNSDANRAFIAGLLGGEGVEPRGSDLTISANTTVEYELRSIDVTSTNLPLRSPTALRETSRTTGLPSLPRVTRCSVTRYHSPVDCLSSNPGSFPTNHFSNSRWTPSCRRYVLGSTTPISMESTTRYRRK